MIVPVSRFVLQVFITCRFFVEMISFGEISVAYAYIFPLRYQDEYSLSSFFLTYVARGVPLHCSYRHLKQLK